MAAKNFHVYKSSAGSGKTYTLVKEYLKIVLRDPGAVKHILAITFTNAAAAEMKGRIIEELGKIAALDGTNADNSAGKLLDGILEDWKEDEVPLLPEETLIHNARLALKRILHQYADFSVSTIDSFIHRVVRTFAFDLHIPLNFEVELDTKSLINKAVDLLINRVGTDAKLTRLLLAYMINQTDDEADTRLEIQIAQMAVTLTEEDSTEHIQKLRTLDLQQFEKIASKLKKEVRRFEKHITGEATHAINLIINKDLSPTDFFQGKRGIYGYFQHLANGNIRDKIEPNKYVFTTIEEDKWVSGKCPAPAKASIAELQADLTRSYNTIRTAVDEEFAGYMRNIALLRNIFPLAVLNEVELMLEEIKSENVLLHISDFNKRIAAIVSEQPIPFIYERLGERYRHYMIDEFQDTSALQWQNLLPLIENSLAGGNNSLVVGDGKQAIYRFRNGDVEQFARLPELTDQIQSVAKPEWQVTLSNNYNYEPLNTNWRSHQEIVAFNNSFFTHTRQHLPESLQSIYDGVHQNARKDKPGGYVSISFLEASEENNLKEVMVSRVIAAIRQCQDAGHMLSDITVLCRANKDASLVARELLANQIPVISPESLLLSHSKEVNFMLAVLRLLDNPGDRIAAVEMLSFLLHKGIIKNHATLHGCLIATGLFSPEKQKTTASLYPALEQIIRNNGMDFSFNHFSHQNIYDSCESILRQFFTKEQPPNPFVAFFMDAVYDFSEKNMLSYADFLAWWDEQSSKYSIVVPEGVEAVQVMTVHKSKGLQFPVVIHPFAHQKANKPTKAGFWLNSEEAGVPELPAAWLSMNKSGLEGTPFEAVLEEEMGKTFLDMLNATYVAFTRPVEKLFIFTKKEESHKPATVNGLLHDFLAHAGLWLEDTNEYTFGEFESRSPDTKDSEPGETPFRETLSNPWSHALRMKSHHLDRSIIFDKSSAIERGNLMHRAMERIASINDLDAVLRQMLDHGEIDEEIRSEWDVKIRELLKHPEVAPCFAPGIKIKTEAGMYDSHGNFYRPDRVVFLENQCVIIDYKSGSAYQKHNEQMDTYAYILKSMGYPDVKKLLLYLDQGKAKTV